MPDFFAADHGSIITMTPMTPHDPHDRQGPRMGRSYAIEPRYFDPIVDGILVVGLTITAT